MITTNNVSTFAASAEKPAKRVPNDAFVLLCEIDPDRLSEDELRRYVNLCDAGLRWLDKEFKSDLMDPEFGRLCLMTENSFLNEVKKAKRTPLSKKLASARRYRNRRQQILRKKKEAENKKSHEIIKKKMAFSKKTRTGREERNYNVNEANFHPGWAGKGTTFAEFMQYYEKQNKEENQKWIKEYLKPTNRKLVVVEADGTRTDAELFVIRKVKEINDLLKGKE